MLLKLQLGHKKDQKDLLANTNNTKEIVQTFDVSELCTKYAFLNRYTLLEAYEVLFK